jgi:hypothetical protein
VIAGRGEIVLRWRWACVICGIVGHNAERVHLGHEFLVFRGGIVDLAARLPPAGQVTRIERG